LPTEQRTVDLVTRLADRLRTSSRSVAAAESLTGGMLTGYLATGPEASAWLQGGIVAYTPQVKQHVLGLSPGPVVSERAAQEMASGCSALFGADLTLALTGVGGPDRQDGLEPGTVWMAARGPGTILTQLEQLAGDPASICEQACFCGLSLLVDNFDRLTNSQP